MDTRIWLKALQQVVTIFSLPRMIKQLNNGLSGYQLIRNFSEFYTIYRQPIATTNDSLFYATYLPDNGHVINQVDIASGKMINTFRNAGNSFFALRGDLLYNGREIWKISTGTFMGELENFGNSPRLLISAHLVCGDFIFVSASYSPALNNNSRFVSQWSTNGTFIRNVTYGDVRFLAATGDNLFTGIRFSNIEQWSIETGKLLKTYPMFTGPIAASGDYLYMRTSNTGKVSQLQISTGKVVREFGTNYYATSIVISGPYIFCDAYSGKNKNRTAYVVQYCASDTYQLGPECIPCPNDSICPSFVGYSEVTNTSVSIEGVLFAITVAIFSILLNIQMMNN